jgi:hypothetical protein
MKGEVAPGGEALRRRVTEMWELWDDKLKDRLRGSFNDPEILEIVSAGDYPDGHELGPLCWSAYRESLKLEADLKDKFGTLVERSALARQFAKELSAYGEARERAGYRGAQLEMLAADQLANWKATASGNVAKTTRTERRVQLLVNYIVANSLTRMKPTTIARNANLQTKINEKIKSLGSVGEKQLERELIEAFSLLRSKVLVPYVAKLKGVDQEPKALLRQHREELASCISAAGISAPSTDKQFEAALDIALREARSASPV